jgi:hypothetical protein
MGDRGVYITGINQLNTVGRGRSLSGDGIRGIQQLICKVFSAVEVV